MSFPADPLTEVLEIAPGADLTADPSTWTWIDITRYLRKGDNGPTALVGRGKLSPLTDTVPASLTVQLDNTGGRFTPRNPIGPWFGLLRRNTPIRHRVNPGSGLVTRMAGYVPRWPPRWNPARTNEWVTITAYGSMRRLSTAGKAERSALYRYISEARSVGLRAYWAMEDGSQATEGASDVAGVQPLAPSAPVRFGNAAPLSGVSTMLDPSGAYLVGRPPALYAVDWRLECVVSHSDVPAASVRVLSWISRGEIQAWNLISGSTGFVLEGFTAVSGGTKVINIATGFLPQPGHLHHLRVDVTRPASNVIATVYVDGVSSGTASVVAGITLSPILIRVNADAASTDVPLVGHLAVWTGTPLFSAGLTAEVALGMVGEHAHARIEAVCADQGVPVSPVYGGSVSSEPLGPRPTDSLMAVLRDAEATDGGILYELTTGELSYLRRDALYNQPVALTLDYAARQVGQPFQPAEDDQQLLNDVTAKRPSGSESRYSDEDHVAAEGRYEAPLPVNPESDSRLRQMAAWAVHKGTTPEQRFDNLTLNLSHPQAAGLVSAWLACDIGSRIQVTNVPAHLSPDTVDLILVGYTETFEYPRGWRVDMVCEPAAPWTVGVLEDTVLGRLDTAGSELATGNTSAQATDTSATPNYIVVPDVSAVGFSVGDQCVLHDANGYRKESTVFTVTAKASAFGFTNISFTPPAQEPPTGVFAGAGDTIRRVDETTLTVTTTEGPLWVTDSGEFPIDLNVDGEKVPTSAIASSVRDTFSRTTSNGWGTSDSSHAWTIGLGTASDFSTNGSEGLISLSAINAERHITTDLGSTDIQDMRLWLTLPVTPTGAQINWGVLLRYVDSNNYCWADVQVGTDSSLTLRLIKRVAGTATQLTTLVSGVTHSTSVPRILRAAVDGDTLRSKVWSSDATEPDWQLTTSDSSLPAGSLGGAVARLMTGNTNTTPVQFRFDNLAVLNPQTFTVSRGVNGVRKGHAAGVSVRLWQPMILGL